MRTSTVGVDPAIVDGAKNAPTSPENAFKDFVQMVENRYARTIQRARKSPIMYRSGTWFVTGIASTILYVAVFLGIIQMSLLKTLGLTCVLAFATASIVTYALTRRDRRRLEDRRDSEMQARIAFRDKFFEILELRKKIAELAEEMHKLQDGIRLGTIFIDVLGNPGSVLDRNVLDNLREEEQILLGDILDIRELLDPLERELLKL